MIRRSKTKKILFFGLVISISLLLIANNTVGVPPTKPATGHINGFVPPTENTEGSITIGGTTLLIPAGGLTPYAISVIQTAMAENWFAIGYYNPDTMYITLLLLYPTLRPHHMPAAEEFIFN